MELGALLGRGGMGSVYAGTFEGRPVAVKVVDADAASEPAFVRAFRAEVQAMATLDHPNVVRVHGFGVADASSNMPVGSPWVVMELAPGSLARECGVHPWPVVRAWLEQLLAGLAHAHARGITHRDLKPANVLLAEGIAKIADFGLARAFESVGSGVTEQPAGTPGYMPPEQRQGRWRDLGPWTDLYALGRLALDLVSLPGGGTIPVPHGFAGWVARLRQERPLDRYRRAADALVALRGLADASGPLDGAFGGVGSHADSTFALTEPYFQERDPVAAMLPEPMPVVLAPVPDRPWSELAPSPDAGLAFARSRSVAGLEPVAELLWDAVRRAAAGGVEIVALRGPEGAGKRDLALWLCHRVHETGVGAVELATHDPHLGPRSGLPGLLARELRCMDLDRSAAFERVSAWLRDHPLPERPSPPQDTWEAAALVAVMAPALGPGERPHVSLGPPEQRFELIARFLERDAEGRVPLVWLDGLHHARDTLAWMAWLRRRGGRFVLLATTEGDALDGALAELGARVIELGTAEPDRVERAVVRPLGVPAGALSAALAARSGGDRWMARHLLAAWRRAGVVDGTELVGELPPDPGRAALWGARVDEVLAGRGRAAGLVLACAAVFGIEVNQVRWRDVCRRARVAFDEGLLDALMVRGLAVTVGLGDAGDWRFVSAELRDVVMDRAGEQRARLHRAAAMACRVEPETVLERAHHLERAGDLAGAVAALRETVEPLVAGHEGPLLRGVIDRLGALVAGRGATEDRAWLALGQLALDGWNGLHADVVARGPEVIGRAAAWPAAWARAGILVGRSALAVGDDDLAERCLEPARTLAGTAQDALAAEADGWLALLRLRQGAPADALELLAQADVRRRDPAVVLGTAIFRARAWSALGDDLRAEQALGAAHELAASAGWVARAEYANSYGELCRARGDLEAAAQHYDHAFLAARSANQDAAWLYLTNRAFTDLLRGRDEDAARALARAARELEARDQVRFAATARLLELVLAARSGDASAWDARRSALSTLDALGAVDRDLASAAELAADAMAPVDPARAAVARGFAARQRAAPRGTGPR